MVLCGMLIPGRRRRYLEAGFFVVLLVVLYGVCVVKRQRRYLEAGIFSSSGGLVWRLRGRA